MFVEAVEAASLAAAASEEGTAADGRVEDQAVREAEANPPSASRMTSSSRRATSRGVK